MARGVRFLLGFRQYPFLKKNGPGIPVFGYCPSFLLLAQTHQNPGGKAIYLFMRKASQFLETYFRKHSNTSCFPMKWDNDWLG